MFEKIFGDYAELGISLLVAGLLLGSVSGSTLLSRQYQEKQLESQVTSNEIKEQRNNLFFNNTNVYQQDIVALILKYKGDKEVHIKLKNGLTYAWTNMNKSSTYKVSDVSVLLPKDSLYDSDLIYGPNKYNVIGYQFVEK